MRSPIKILVISIYFLLISLFISAPAYSRGGGGGGGCFAEGTLILTPEGSKQIEQLHSGDVVINYNFSTRSRDKGTISKIEIIDSPDYYLINNLIKVTGTHPFYIKTSKGIELIRVRDLHSGDRLIEQDNSLVTVDSMEHVYNSITVYNLISINPNHNFYADGFLVHNKGGGGGGGSYGGVASGGQPTITEKNFLGFLQALALLTAGLSTVLYWQQIYNFITYTGKKFTEDDELIEHTKNINPRFQNKYSIWYAPDNQIWQQQPPQTELSQTKYQHFISKVELIEKAKTLFIQYQQDWTNKDFQSMKQYIGDRFYNLQTKIFHQNYGKNFDIVYDCNLSAIVPLDIEIRADKYFFRVQINGEMINFKLSSDGYILSGEAYHRSFSEYWDIKLTPDKQCYLVNINQSIET